jgi:hypothetical protein
MSMDVVDFTKALQAGLGLGSLETVKTGTSLDELTRTNRSSSDVVANGSISDVVANPANTAGEP